MGSGTARRETTTLVVPCYNEETRLDAKAFLSFVEAHDDINVLFVNDGSNDGTLEVLRAVKTERPTRFEVLDLATNVGKAEAVRHGLLAATAQGASFVGYWDADLSTSLQEVPRLLAPLAERAHVQAVLGSRIRMLGSDVRRRASRHYLGRVFATAASLVLGLPVYDTQCGAKLLRTSTGLAEVLREPFRSRWIFDVELIARLVQLFRTDGKQVERCFVEVPLHAWHDVPGSKLRLRDGLRAGLDLLQIRRRYRPAVGQSALSPGAPNS